MIPEELSPMISDEHLGRNYSKPNIARLTINSGMLE